MHPGRHAGRSRPSARRLDVAAGVLDPNGRGSSEPEADAEVSAVRVDHIGGLKKFVDVMTPLKPP
jgi:hypothetical protein